MQVSAATARAPLSSSLRHQICENREKDGRGSALSPLPLPFCSVAKRSLPEMEEMERGGSETGGKRDDREGSGFILNR